MFEVGDGPAVNVYLASKYYFLAAEKMSQMGQWKAARDFERGLGLGKNVHRAVYYYKICANNGHRGAQRKTVAYYMKGHDVERSRIYVRRTIEESAGEGYYKANLWFIREDLRDALETLRRLST